jgi:hypothetical protein
MKDEFAFVVAFLALGAIAGGALSFGLTTELWRIDTVTRGLAIYCPLDGDWAWIGECEATP